MKTKLAQLMALALSFSAAQLGAQAKAAPKPMCEAAFSVSPSVSLPNDYRLNAHDYAYALAIPEAKQLTQAVREAIELVEKLTLQKTEILRLKPRVGSSKDANQTPVARVFPRTFFDAHFNQRPFVKSLEDITQIEKRYNDLAVELQNERITDEALLVLTLATRRLAETKYDGTEDYRPDMTIDSVVEKFVLKAANLPILLNFMGASDRIFVEFAALNREFINFQLKIDLPEPEGRQAYVERLKQALAEAGPALSWDEKVALSTRLLEPELASHKISMFVACNVGRDRVKQRVKWHGFGGVVMADLISEAYKVAEERNPKNRTEKFAFVRQELFEYVGRREGEAYDLFVEVLQDFLHAADSGLKAEIQSTRNQIVTDITPIIQLIKQAVRDHQGAMRTEKQALEKDQSRQRGIQLAAPVVSRKTDPLQSAQGPSLTKSIKAAMEKAEPATTDEDVSKAPEAPGFVAPEGPALADVTLANVTPGVSYWFNSAETFRIQLNKDADAQDPSRYIMHVQFTKRVLDEIRAKRLDFRAWVAVFLKGPVPGTGMNGLKKLGFLNGLSWEIKLISSNDRISVQQDPVTKKLWIWEKTGDHKGISRQKPKKRK